MNQSNVWTDWVGVAASVACAIHCAAMPFVVALLPMMGLSFLADESFHQVMVVVCSVLAAAAFIPGLRRHRRLLPMGVASVGLMLIATAAFALEGECCVACDTEAPTLAISEATDECEEACCEHCAVESQTADAADAPAQASIVSALSPFAFWITPLGGLLLVSAHLTNRKFSCQCGCCPTEEETEAFA